MAVVTAVELVLIPDSRTTACYGHGQKKKKKKKKNSTNKCPLGISESFIQVNDFNIL